MTVYMSWGSEQEGQASGLMTDIDHACETLDVSLSHVLQVNAIAEDSFRYRLLTEACEDLKRRMRADGRTALADGKPWHGKSGPAWVSLWPGNGPRRD